MFSMMLANHENSTSGGGAQNKIDFAVSNIFYIKNLRTPLLERAWGGG